MADSRRPASNEPLPAIALGAAFFHTTNKTAGSRIPMSITVDYRCAWQLVALTSLQIEFITECGFYLLHSIFTDGTDIVFEADSVHCKDLRAVDVT